MKKKRKTDSFSQRLEGHFELISQKNVKGVILSLLAAILD